MGVEFSYEKFQKLYLEFSSQKKQDNILGVKMATDAPVAVLVNNHSYDELLTAFTQLNEKVNKVTSICTLIDKMEDKLCRIARVRSRRMW